MDNTASFLRGERDLDVLVDFMKDFDGKINVLLRVKLKENTIRTEKYFVFGMNSDVVNKSLYLFDQSIFDFLRQ